MPTIYERYLPYIALRSVVGSRAYGLATAQSDTDVRGFFVLPAEEQWGLNRTREHFPGPAGTDELYWEIQHMLHLLLSNNPNVMDALWAPEMEVINPFGEELLNMRNSFLSRRVYETYSGYAKSQMHKMHDDIQAGKPRNWKHAMHMIRLLVACTEILQKGEMVVDVGSHRDMLLSIRAGEVAWEQVEKLQGKWQESLEKAYAASTLPLYPDKQAAEQFLLSVRGRVAKDYLESLQVAPEKGLFL